VLDFLIDSISRTNYMNIISRVVRVSGEMSNDEIMHKLE